MKILSQTSEMKDFGRVYPSPLPNLTMVVEKAEKNEYLVILN
jgi:hypothetical protein